MSQFSGGAASLKWVQAHSKGLGEEKMGLLRMLLERKVQRGPILWRWKSVRLYAVTV